MQTVRFYIAKYLKFFKFTELFIAILKKKIFLKQDALLPLVLYAAQSVFLIKYLKSYKFPSWNWYHMRQNQSIFL